MLEGPAVSACGRGRVALPDTVGGRPPGGWEAGFLLTGAAKAAVGGDSGYVAGCLFRVVGVLAQVLHARAGRWLVNEKGMIAAAGRLPGAPPSFTQRAQALLGAVGRSPAELAATIGAARELVTEVVG